MPKAGSRFPSHEFMAVSVPIRSDRQGRYARHWRERKFGVSGRCQGSYKDHGLNYAAIVASGDYPGPDCYRQRRPGARLIVGLAQTRENNRIHEFLHTARSQRWITLYVRAGRQSGRSKFQKWAARRVMESLPAQPTFGFAEKALEALNELDPTTSPSKATQLKGPP